MRTLDELRQAQRALSPRFNGLRQAVQRLGYDARPGTSMRDLERSLRELADLIAAELAKVDAIRAERAVVEAAMQVDGEAA